MSYKLFNISCRILFFIIMPLLIMGFSSKADAIMSISVDPTEVDFGDVNRGTFNNAKETDDLVVNVVSEDTDYFFSMKGNDLEGQSAPAMVIPVDNVKFELDGSGDWEKLSATLTPLVHGAVTGAGGDDYTFDFTLDVPGDIFFQEYQGTLTFDVTTLDFTFDPNGNETYAMSHSAEVTVDSGESYILFYQWSLSDVAGGLVEEDWEEFTSGDELITPAGVTGDYYLWVDVAGFLFRSNRFRVDNIAPTGTISINDGDNYATPFSTLTLTLSSSDAHSGVSQMRFRSGTSGGWSDWEAYDTEKNWYQYLFNEDFESGTFPPDDWDTNMDDGLVEWDSYSGMGGGGDWGGSGNYAGIEHDAGDYLDSELRSPWIHIPGNNYELAFWEYVSKHADHVYHGIWIGTDDGGSTSWEELEELGSRNSGGWYFRRVDLSDYEGEDIRISFRYRGEDADNWYIDNVYVMNTIKGGVKTVQVQYRDNAGNISAAYSDTIKVHALYWYGEVEDWVEGFVDPVGAGTPLRQLDALDVNGVHKYLDTSPSFDWSEMGYVTDNTFDLTGVNNIYIQWKNTGQNAPQNRSRLIVSADKMANDNTGITASIQKTRTFALVTENLTVNTLNASYYIRVHSKNNAGVSRPSIVHSYRVWFE